MSVARRGLRQGDVLIRPISEQFLAQPIDEKWEIFQTIWRERLRQVENTKPANRAAAAAAITSLYAASGRPEPTVHWHEGKALDRWKINGLPIRHIPDLVLHGVWFKCPMIERIVSLMGYDAQIGSFRITSNKQLLSREFRLRARIGSRPLWTRDLGNMISQFDVPSVALYDYAVATNIAIEPSLARLAESLKRVLDTTFAAILFEQSCILLDRPEKITLDPTQFLSATSIDPRTMRTHSAPNPAYLSRTGQIIYAVNGIVIPPDHLDHITWNAIASVEIPRLRSALISYWGWECFFDLVPRHAKRLIDQSKYGALYQIDCNAQQIMVIQVTNSTAEPDGSHRKHVMPVDHALRPLPNPANPASVMGAPQSLTALNAVASTFGMTGRQYEAILAAES